MRVGILAVLALAAFAALVVGTPDPRTANACSWGLGTAAGAVPELFSFAPVVAAGTFSDATPTLITFTVEEPFQGTAAGMAYRVDNRWPLANSDCGGYYLGPNLPGHRFADGQRAVLSLSKEVGGAWQTWDADTMMDGDELRPLEQVGPFPEWPKMPEPTRMADMRRAIAELAATPFDAGYEMRGPCNGPPFTVGVLATYVADSTLIGIAHIRDRDNGATTLVLDEVLRGEVAAGQAVTMNDHYLRPIATSCRRELGERNPAGPIPTSSYLVFLRPDEYGVAEYQVAVFGYGMMQVNERYVAQGMATLADFRAAAKEVGAANNPIVAPSAGAAAAVADDQDVSGIAVVGLVSAIIAAVALFSASRTRIKGRGR